MKKMLLVSLMLLLIVPLVSAEVTLTTNILKYEPIPTQPGQYVTVFVELENNGNEDAPNAVIGIVDQFPFTATGEGVKEIGTLKSQQSYVHEFRLRVDSQAIVGENNLLVRYTADQYTNMWKEDKHIIRVQPTKASLAVSDITITPEEIAPGEEGLIQLTIKNTADSTLRDISLQLGLVNLAGNTVVDLPFIPTNSVTEKQVSALAPNKQTILSYTIKAYPTAQPGYYKLPLTMSYYDEEGTETEKNDYIGVIVQAVPELKIYVENSEQLKQGQESNLDLKFVNKGVSDLKFLDVKLLRADDYEISGTGEAYIGDLDSDDYRTETFKITPKKEQIQLMLSYTYKDDNNVAFEKTEAVVLDCNCSDTSNQKTSPWIVALVIIVVLSVIVISRRSKKKKASKK